jgi:hypothetical protein
METEPSVVVAPNLSSEPERGTSLAIDVVAVSTATIKAIGMLASLSSDQASYLSRIRGAGLHDLEEVDFRNVPDERRAAFRENVKARYIDLIATIPR